MDAADIAALGELAYAAAIDDSLWWDWVERMVAAFGTQGALFWVIDARRAEMCRSAFHFRDVDLDALAAEYLGGPVQHDPQMRRVLGANASQIYTDLDHVDLNRSDDREYVAWQYARIGTRHHLTAAAVLSDTIRAGVALHTSPEAGPATGCQRKALTAMFPDIARSLRLGIEHSAQLQEAWWEGEQRDRDAASILLDEHGEVVRFSMVATELIAANDGIDVSRHRLRAAAPADDEQLQAIVQHAIRDRAPSAGAMTIGRRSGRRAYQVLIYPLVRRRRFLAPSQAAALVHLVDPCKVSPRVTELQQDLFALSSREAEVADLLLAGHSLESLAAVLGISRNTARVHLQSLFRKTGSNRQSELLRNLLAAC